MFNERANNKKILYTTIIFLIILLSGCELGFGTKEITTGEPRITASNTLSPTIPATITPTKITPTRITPTLVTPTLVTPTLVTSTKPVPTLSYTPTKLTPTQKLLSDLEMCNRTDLEICIGSIMVTGQNEIAVIIKFSQVISQSTYYLVIDDKE